MCADEVDDADEGQVSGESDQWTDPIQEVHGFDRSIDPDSIIDLSFPQQREESDFWAIDPIQVGSLGDSRMNQLLHPAARDYSVVIHGAGAIPQLHTSHLTIFRPTSPGLTFCEGTRCGMLKGPVDLLSGLHVQRTPLSNLVYWFFDSPAREGERVRVRVNECECVRVRVSE